MRVASSRVLVEEALEHVDHEFHRRVVVVQQQHPVHVRTLGPRLRLRDDGRARAVVARTAPVRAAAPPSGREWCAAARIRGRASTQVATASHARFTRIDHIGKRQFQIHGGNGCPRSEDGVEARTRLRRCQFLQCIVAARFASTAIERSGERSLVASGCTLAVRAAASRGAKRRRRLAFRSMAQIGPRQPPRLRRISGRASPEPEPGIAGPREPEADCGENSPP